MPLPSHARAVRARGREDCRGELREGHIRVEWRMGGECGNALSVGAFPPSLICPCVPFLSFSYAVWPGPLLLLFAIISNQINKSAELGWRTQTQRERRRAFPVRCACLRRLPLRRVEMAYKRRRARRAYFSFFVFSAGCRVHDKKHCTDKNKKLSSF